MVSFFKELRCANGALRNWPKKRISTHWLVHAKSKEDKSRIYGKWHMFHISLTSFPWTLYDVFFINCVDGMKSEDSMW